MGYCTVTVSLLFAALIAYANAVCPLISYTPQPNCIAPNSNEQVVRIASGFQTSMDSICAAATACSIRLYITQSFRLSSSGVKNVVYEPAPHSNHLVGYAIDMNTVSANGRLCNYACLDQTAKWTADISCFIAKIRTSPPLRYGGDFTSEKKDWVHIDGGPFYQTNPTGYTALYNQIRQECYGGTAPPKSPTHAPPKPHPPGSGSTAAPDDCDPTDPDCSTPTPNSPLCEDDDCFSPSPDHDETPDPEPEPSDGDDGGDD